MSYKVRAVGLSVLVAVLFFLVFAPTRLLEIAHNFLALWSFALLAASLATLVWFLYWFFLRRIMRARRIANLRLKRMVEERRDDRPNLP